MASAPANASSANESSGGGDDEGPPYGPAASVAIALVLLCVIVGTIVGNILVCVAVCLVRKLRRPCNYLLVSLAVSDLCVAILVMPVALLYEILGHWSFGPVICDLWVSFDVLSCTASILNLCMISVDRYYAITKPLEYGVKRTPKRMIVCVSLVWLGAACISLPPLLILGNEHGKDGNACSVCQNFGYQIYATLGSFYIPLTVMIVVYHKIFQAARKIVLEERRAQSHLRLTHAEDPAPPVLLVSNKNGTETKLWPEKSGQAQPVMSKSRLRFTLAKERKASTTLGIIMSAFTVCWLPFFVLALVRPFLPNQDGIPSSLSSLFLWLGYANSLLNPIIYATLNKDFRKPFQQILYFRCSSLNLMMREEFYHSQYGDPTANVTVGGHTTRHHANNDYYCPSESLAVRETSGHQQSPTEVNGDSNGGAAAAAETATAPRDDESFL
ncbi:5-hydroxytryptamine receptor 1-like [Neocloeon triangulifer]|uniref:5-hydroxytryptamine receptor 1-like n=1 Tax=Neocloeon triangulifer TaxID=2078957 RepID=UPI00286F6E23|nr:5-hydroxytryptamine receptor 1-like [Neocloeon triangulifer]